MKRILLRSLFAFLFVVVVGGLLYQQQLLRLYRTIHLFDADVIVWNFSNLDRVADTVRIPPAGPANSFGRRPAPLPAQFEFRGQRIDTGQWLSATATTALLVLHGDDIVYESYLQGTGEFDQRISWSVAKSFLSALFGVAVHEGLLPDLGAPVTDYVPSLAGSGYDGVPIIDVLQMSSGVRFDEDYGDFNSDINRMGRILALGGSFDEFAASLQNERAPGTQMHYVSIDTHVLGMVLRAVTRQPYAEWFEQRLWSRIGAERDALYIVDSEGQPMVLGGLNLITRDYARFGQLMRDGGRLDGVQVIPGEWVRESTTPGAPRLQPSKAGAAIEKFGYGYQWWIPPGAQDEFMAIGIYGQYIYVDPDAGIVIVKNSADRRFMDNDFENDYRSAAAFRAISRSVAGSPRR